MTTEQLLMPRRKVSEEGYPDMIFHPNQIIELNKWDKESSQWYWLSPKKNHWYEPFFDRFPSIFQKLEWWEDRKPEDMPAFVKITMIDDSVKVLRVLDPIHNRREFGHEPYTIEHRFIYPDAAGYEPATAAEYEAYQATLKQQ